MADNGKRKIVNDIVKNASALVARANLAAKLGKQFTGDRDLYDALGYKKTPEYSDFEAFYLRQEFAGRVVDLPAEDTWRRPPVLIDGDARTDEGKQTDFIKGILELQDKLRIWHYFERVDRLAGIGRYAVLLIGVPGEMKSPVSKGGQKIAYLGTYSEGDAEISSKEKDSKSSRFGLPVEYKLTFGDVSKSNIPVHWSRIIHVADGKLTSEIYGTPRLERVLNRFFDLEKVYGASAEAAWLSAFKGLVFKLLEGFQFPEKTSSGGDAQEELLEEIEEYIHGMRRFIRTAGMDVQELSGSISDPRGIVDSILKAVSAGSGIPVRILTGSEMGELASSQDQANWAAQIAARQTNYAEPEILRPFVDWCVDHKVITAPSSGKYSVEWGTQFELNDIEKAEIAQRYADAMFKASGGVPDTIMAPEVFAERFMNYKQEEQFPEQPGSEDDTDVDDVGVEEDAPVE